MSSIKRDVKKELLLRPEVESVSRGSIKRDVKKKLLLRPEVESVSRDPAHGASVGKFSESILVVSSVAV
jgi:hypothetical protein